MWRYEWKYPLTGVFKQKPVVNALFEEVGKAVAQAQQLREQGS